MQNYLPSRVEHGEEYAWAVVVWLEKDLPPGITGEKFAAVCTAAL